MKVINKIICLFSIVLAAAVFTGCSNVIEELKGGSDTSSSESFTFEITPDSDIGVTVSDKILTADEGYTDYAWYVDGALQAGNSTNVLNLTSILTVSGTYNIALEAKKDGRVYCSSMYVKIILCSNCGTEYATKAEADACGKENGCPEYNAS